eukprot:4143729-Prymnesium_polylepis.2
MHAVGARACTRWARAHALAAKSWAVCGRMRRTPSLERGASESVRRVDRLFDGTARELPSSRARVATRLKRGGSADGGRGREGRSAVGNVCVRTRRAGQPRLNTHTHTRGNRARRAASAPRGWGASGGWLWRTRSHTCPNVPPTARPSVYVPPTTVL